MYRGEVDPTLELKQGPLAGDVVIGAPRGARVPQGTSHKDFALFGAPSPLKLRTRARRGKEPACLL